MFRHSAGLSGSQAPPPQEARAPFTRTQRPGGWKNQSACTSSVAFLLLLLLNKSVNDCHTVQSVTDRPAPELHKRRVTTPKWTAKVGDGAALAERSLFINCERLRDSQPQLFPHVVTGGPMVLPLRRRHSDRSVKHQRTNTTTTRLTECRQNSNLLLITYLFFTFVREVCGRKAASSGEDASSEGLQGGGDDNTSSIRRDNFFFSKLRFTEFFFFP